MKHHEWIDRLDDHDDADDGVKVLLLYISSLIPFVIIDVTMITLYSCIKAFYFTPLAMVHPAQ